MSGELSSSPLAVLSATSAGEMLGFNVSSAGDLDGDGFDDLVAGAPGWNKSRGRAYVFFGGRQFSGGLNQSDAGVIINGRAFGDQLGWDVTGGGDMNGNGYPDIAVSAPGSTGSAFGAVYIIDGYRLAQEAETGDGLIDLSTDSVNSTITSGVQGDAFGSSISMDGDLNGGPDDLVIGAPEPAQAGVNLSSTADFTPGTYNSTLVSTAGGELKLNLGLTHTWTTQADFDACTQDNITSYPAGNVTLSKLGSNYNRSGNLTSEVFDSGGNVYWQQLIWGEDYPYGDGLPHNNAVEEFPGGINMTGNVLLYHLDENGTDNCTIVDYSGSGNHGKLWLGTSPVNASAPGVINTSIDFDNDNDCINVTTNDNLNITDDISIAAWVNFGLTSTATKIEYIIEKGYSDYDNYAFYILKQGNKYELGFEYTSSTGVYENIDSTLADMDLDTLYHVAVTVKGTALKFYLNGVNYQSFTMTNTIVPYPYSVSVGRQQGQGTYIPFWFNGMIDELAVWNRTLGDSEIYNVFRRGAMDLRFQVRADDDDAGWGKFIGPNGTTYSSYMHGNRSVLNLSANRYFQFKANFTTMYSDMAPVMHNVTLYYSPAQATYMSRVIDAGTVVNWTTLDWNALAPAGTSLGLQLSTSNDNSSWSAWSASYSSPQSPLSGIPDSRYIRWRVRLATTDAFNTPVLKDVTISYGTSSMVYVYFGSPSLGAVLSTGDANLNLTEGVAGDRYGASVAIASDVDGDGYDEVLVGAPLNDTVAAECGRVSLYYGGTAMDAFADVNISGNFGGDLFGWSVAGAGRTTGSSYGDIIIGAPGTSLKRGSAYLYTGNGSLMAKLSSAQANVTLIGNATGDMFGFSVETAGDMNVDGRDDIVIGAPFHDNQSLLDRGAAYLFISHKFKSTLVSFEANHTFLGESSGDRFGHCVAPAGDVNYPGIPELAAGAPYWDAPGPKTDAGRAYVFGDIPIADHLKYVSGDDQEWYVAQDLPSPVVLQALNETGRPVPWALVNFTFLSVPPGASGHNFKESGTTFYQAAANVTGHVRTTIHLGTKAGNYAINVTGDNFTGNGGPVFINTVNATAFPESMNNISLAPMYTHPDGRKIVKSGTLTGYTAVGYDKYGNRNMTWSPVWGTTDALGTASSTGGSAAAGFTGKYDAGAVPGYDNITVGDALGLASNRSSINITDVLPQLSYIVLTPNYTAAAPKEVNAGRTLYGFKALGYNDDDSLNTTWTPKWGVTHYRGTLLAWGSAATGWMANYTAGGTPGKDNVTVSNGTITNRTAVEVVPGNLSRISLVPMYAHPAGRVIKVGGVLGGYTALGYDAYGNKNTSWAASWGTTASLGSITSAGGDAASGFTAGFTAGTTPGLDNITVADLASGTITNASAIAVVPGDLVTIALTPKFTSPASRTVQAGGVLSGYTALGYDSHGNLNLSWAPSWGTTNGLGSPAPAGGSAGSGFLCTYTSTGATGHDNLTVADAASGLVTNASGIEVVPGALAGIELSPSYVYPASMSISAGKTAGPFTAFGFDAYGNRNLSWSPVWGNTSGLGAVVSAGGSAALGFTASFQAGTSPGLDNLTVTGSSTMVSNATQIRIVPGAPFRLVLVSGDLQTATVNTTLPVQLTVRVEDIYANPLAGETVYFNITTTGLNGDAGFNPSGNTTEAVATGAGGTASISLRLDTLAGKNNVTAEVQPAILLSSNFTSIGVPDDLFILEIVPGQAELVVNTTRNFTLSGTDRYLNPVELNGTVWKTNAGVLEAFGNADARLRASKTPGSGRFVKASVGAVEVNATVDIVPGALHRIAVSPESVNLETGATRDFTAAGFDIFDNPVILKATSWETDSGIILEFNDTSALFVAQGNAKTGGYIKASAGQVSGSAVIDIYKLSNPPKINGRVPDVHLIEDGPSYTMRLTQYEFDLESAGTALDWYITNKDDLLYTVAGEYSDDDNIIVTPNPDVYGNDLVTLWLTDSDGFTDSQPLWINITPVNDPPVFKDPPDLIVRFDDPYTFNYGPYISDKESSNNELTFSVDEKVEGKYTTVSGLNVTYTYPEKFLDQVIHVVLQVSDGINHTFQTVKVTVTSNFVPEVTKELPDITLYEGEALKDVFDLDDYFTDPDDNSIFFSYGETHVQVSIDPDHTVDISSPGEWFGVDTITFRATDPSSAIAEDTIKVTVLPLNDPPSISGVPDLTVHYDQEYTFDLFYYISDVDNKTSDLRLRFLDPASKLGMDMANIWTDPGDNLVMHLLYPEAFLGQKIPVSITVSDGVSTAYQDITVTVSDDWPPEVVAHLPDVHFFEDTVLKNAFNLNDYFIDRDEDILFYTYGHDYINITIHTDGTAEFSAPLNWFGTEYVTFRATDSKGALVEERILVTVVPVNDAPVIGDIPVLKISTGLENFDLSPYISDIDSELLTVSVETDQEDLLVFINGFDLVIISEYALTTRLYITVSDNEDTAEGYLDIEITGQEVEPEKDEFDLFRLLFLIIVVLILVFILLFLFVYLRGFGKIEALYLIHEDGRLIRSVTSADVDDPDEQEVLSGMFTAIHDLIDDTFTSGGSNIRRKKIEFEGKRILIEKGEHIYLTLIVEGRPGRMLQRSMTSTVAEIEAAYPAFGDWEGKRHELNGIERYFEKYLKSPADPGTRAEYVPPAPAFEESITTPRPSVESGAVEPKVAAPEKQVLKEPELTDPEMEEIEKELDSDWDDTGLEDETTDAEDLELEAELEELAQLEDLEYDIDEAELDSDLESELDDILNDDLDDL